MKRTLLFVLLAIVFAAAGYVAWQRFGDKIPLSSPSPSATPLADNMIILDTPLPDGMITSPLVVKGRARGTWFFEASFPVVLTDWDGRIIAQVPAQAQSDWMTEEFVPFEATLTFTKPSGPGVDQPNRGFLILQKDNPSGLPEHDDSREITVFFK